MELKRLDNDDLLTILGTLNDFAERELPFDKRTKWDEEDICPEDIVKTMLSEDVGLHLVFIPEEYGGLGGGAYDVYRLSCEFAKKDVGVATSMLAVALGTDPIRVGCTPEQKEKWMTRIAEEGLIVAYGVTEPEAGSNVESLKTKAERIIDENGNITHYKLNGVKQFISNGGIANLYTILAKAPDGPTFFVVERETEGIEPGKQEEKHGIRLSNTTQVILEDCIIPAENIVGTKEGQGIKHSNEVFGFTRLMVAAFGLGGGLSALEKAIAYSKERKQFGDYLYKKQGYTHKLIVPNAVRLAAAQAYIEYVAGLLDSSEEDRQIEGSVAKFFSTESGNKAAEDAIQAHGGYGYCKEYEVEKIKRDVRILTIYEGTSEIQQNIIGVFRMRQVVKGKGKFLVNMAEGLEGNDTVNGTLAAKAAAFLDAAAYAAFKNKLSREQHIIFELATSIAEVETAIQLCKAAAEGDDKLKQAEARIWAAEVAVSAPTRMLKAFKQSGKVSDELMKELSIKADIAGSIDAQSGVLEDMNLVAELLVQD
ncbi:MAG: acyl-CoA dehydrogenase family protein [Deltaproteobacteria bacterium]|nr:acyl-CoA dehydrogenase family protein [Deltaproteobacteria bacterium]